MSEHPDIFVDNVVLVAPWLDPERRKSGDFFDFKIGSDLAASTNKLTIFHSDDDDDDIQESVTTLRNAISGVKYVEFSNYGHFCESDMGTTAFPELLSELVA